MLPPLTLLSLEDHDACDTGVLDGIRKAGRRARGAARHAALQRGVRNREHQLLESRIRDAIRATDSVEQFCDLRVNAAFTSLRERHVTKLQSTRRILDAFRSLADAPFTPQLQAPREKHWTVALSTTTAESIARAFFATRTNAALSYFPDKRTTRASAASRAAGHRRFEEPLANLAREALAALWNVRPDDGSVGRVVVTLQTQDVEKETYSAISQRVHMDNSSDLRSAEYAADPSGLLTNFFITSFCACALADSTVSLRGCGTVLLDGVPVVAPSAVRAAARQLEAHPSLDCSFEELLQTLETAAVHATTELLEGYESDELVGLGVGLRTPPPLAWTQSNRTTFHRSPNRDEVLHALEGDRPAMRGFVLVEVDSTAEVEEEEKEEEAYISPYAFSKHKTQSRMGHPLVVEVRLRVAAS